MDARVDAFLNAVSEHRIRRLGPADHLAVQHLLQRRPELGRSELRAALASLLATNREQWQQIANLFDQYAPQPPPRRAPRGVSYPRLMAAPASDPANAQPTGRQKVQNLTYRWWLSGIMVTLALAIVIPTILILQQPPETSTPLNNPPKVAEPAPDKRWVLRKVTPPQSQQIDVTLQRRPWDSYDGWTIGLSAVLVMLGLRWLLLPGLVTRSRQQQDAQRRHHVAQERRRLAEQAERHHAPVALTYQVERHPPLDPLAIDDAANLLGRLFQTGLSDRLDIAATVRTSIDAGGRLVPVHADHLVARGFTVLVDIERGDHSWLAGIRWVLERWASLGVRFDAYDFQFNPQFVTAHATRQTMALSHLARRTSGEPLLVISRTLTSQELTDRAEWLEAIDVWPVKVWLDPDPRPLRERRREREEIRQLEQLGLQRFPFSAQGVQALARYLLEAGEGVPVPPWPDLPSYHDPQVAEALRTWALLAALVPDASWDQLDAIRRHFPELMAVLPEPYHVQRLIDWVVREDRVMQAESEDGRTLVLSDDLVERLIREQRRIDVGKPKTQRLEFKGRRLLLQQLDATPPEDELLQQLWKAKRVSHLLYLEPPQAVEPLQQLVHSAAGTEVLQTVETELDREAAATAFEPGVRDRLLLLAGRASGRLHPLDLVSGPWQTWRQPIAMFMGALVIGLLLAENIWMIDGKWHLIPPWPERLESLPKATGQAMRVRQWLLTSPVERPEAVLLAVWQVDSVGRVFRDLLPDGTLGPEMVVIPPGTFMMGSPDGQYDEDPHQVRITRPFAMGKYEVTFAEYDRFAEKTRRERPDDIGWGRDDRPVINVSWKDAVAYAEWLSRQTGELYRLPTEAEWEYAARAGTSTAYSFGNDDSQLQAYGWYDNNSRAKTQPVGRLAPNPWGLYDMHGNVWEWVGDWYGGYAADESMQTNPTGPVSGTNRVVRGGSWNLRDSFCRSANRNHWPPGTAIHNLGFRLLRYLD